MKTCKMCDRAEGSALLYNTDFSDDRHTGFWSGGHSQCIQLVGAPSGHGYVCKACSEMLNHALWYDLENGSTSD